jgi:hypothetical protein
MRVGLLVIIYTVIERKTTATPASKDDVTPQLKPRPPETRQKAGKPKQTVNWFKSSQQWSFGKLVTMGTVDKMRSCNILIMGTAFPRVPLEMTTGCQMLAIWLQLSDKRP